MVVCTLAAFLRYRKDVKMKGVFLGTFIFTQFYCNVAYKILWEREVFSMR